jgi:hypothetical protein
MNTLDDPRTIAALEAEVRTLRTKLELAHTEIRESDAATLRALHERNALRECDHQLIDELIGIRDSVSIAMLGWTAPMVKPYISGQAQRAVNALIQQYRLTQ